MNLIQSIGDIKFEFSDVIKKWIITLIAIPIVVFYRFFEGIPAYANHQWGGKITMIWVTGGILGIWTLYKWIFDRKILISGLDLPIILFISLIIIKLLFSEHLSLSVEYSLFLLGYVLAFYLLLDARRNNFIWEGLINGLLIATGISFIYIGQEIYHWMDLYQVDILEIIDNPSYPLKVLPRISLTLWHNVLAVNMVLITPLVIYRFTNTDSVLFKSIYGVYFGLVLFTTFLTKSRGGIVALSTVIFLFVFLSFRHLRNNPVETKIQNIIVIILGVLLIFGVLFVFSRRGLPKTIIPENRLTTWGVSWRMLTQKPVLGIGLGTYGIHYINFRSSLEKPYLTIHPHNEFVTFIVQFGIAGLFIGFLYLVKYGNLIKRNVKMKFRDLKTYCILGLFGFAMHGLIDSFLNIPQVMLMFIFLMVGSIPKGQFKFESRANPRLYFLTIAILLLGAGSAFQVWKLHPYEKARKAATVRQYEESEKWLDVSIDRDPGNTYYVHSKAMLKGNLAYEADCCFDAPIKLFRMALRDYAGWSPEYAHLAELYDKRGEHGKAIDELNRAINHQLENWLYYCLKAEQFWKSDQPTAAINSYAKCVAHEPSILETPRWDENEFLQNNLDIVLSKAGKELLTHKNRYSGSNLYSFYIYSKQHERFDKLMNESESEDEDIDEKHALYLRAKYMVDNHDLKAATNLLEMLVKQEPRYTRAWDLLASCYILGGEWEKAHDAIHISNALYGSRIADWEYGQNLFATWVANRYPFPISWVGLTPEKYFEPSYVYTFISLKEEIDRKDCQNYLKVFQRIKSVSHDKNKISEVHKVIGCNEGGK